MVNGQDLHSVQLFNPQTNDETPVIGMQEHLTLSFDDFSNSSAVYRYTLRHLNRNWQDDGLFFTEIASGSMNAIIDDYQYSFNTVQKYTHYRLKFPNDKMQPKISGNFELIVYRDTPAKPAIVKRFSITEGHAAIALKVSRTADAGHPEWQQRVEVQASGTTAALTENLNSVSLTVIQNNNYNMIRAGLKPSSALGNQLYFQQPNLSFPGNNEFYYFDNKILNQAYDMVAATENTDGTNHTYLHPVWAYPLNYQYQPDVNGAFYFRRNDLGIERDAEREADYSWVYFSLNSEKTDDNLYVLGAFNEYQPSAENQMHYDPENKRYTAKIYLKQGFYNYVLATGKPDGSLDFGKINGSFWQTENLYQALLYYQPFGKNYDGLIGYGEYRTPIR